MTNLKFAEWISSNNWKLPKIYIGKLQFTTTSAILKYNVVNENCKFKTWWCIHHTFPPKIVIKACMKSAYLKLVKCFTIIWVHNMHYLFYVTKDFHVKYCVRHVWKVFIKIFDSNSFGITKKWKTSYQWTNNWSWY